MTEIKNEFYVAIGNKKQEKYKILFSSNYENEGYEGFIAQEEDSKCKIKLYNKIKDVILDNYDDILKEFIELQADNNEIDLSFITFQNEIEKTYFSDIANKKILFANCIFQKKAYFTDLIFKEEVNFEGAEFKEWANFNNTIFSKECSFESVLFTQEVEFKKTKFTDNAKFSSSRFKNFSSFEESIFEKEADFTNTIAKDLFYFHNVSLGNLNLIGSHLDKANFLRLHNKNKDNRVLLKNNLTNKDSARILKSHFENENNTTEANIYFVLEQEFYLELLTKEDSKYPNRIINQISLQFNKYVSNYGTDWVRVLIIIFGFGFLASLGYSFFEEDCQYFISKRHWFIGGVIFSAIMYFLYFNKYIQQFILILFAYIISFIFSSDIQQITNSIATLINPLNIFKPNKEYFKEIVIYGVIVKGIVATLIYQFIISFRNSTRKK